MNERNEIADARSRENSAWRRRVEGGEEWWLVPVLGMSDRSMTGHVLINRYLPGGSYYDNGGAHSLNH